MWQPIETAPKDGSTIRLRTESRPKGFLAAWTDGFMTSQEEPCCCWQVDRMEDDDAFPPCWSEGVCWAVNEDENMSEQPTHWQSASAPPA